MLAPCIVVVTAAARDALNSVWSVMPDGNGGTRGPGTFSRALCAIDPEADSETEPTHFLMQDMGAKAEDVALWSAMAENNDLPPILGTWGEDGVIAAQDAQAAIGGGNMFVFPAYGLKTMQDRDQWRDGVLAGMGLQFVPEAEDVF